MEIETRIFIILMVAKYGMTEKNATRNNTIPDVTTRRHSQITTEDTKHDFKTGHTAIRHYIITDVTTKTDSQITTECTTHDLKTEHKVLCQEETLDITCPNGTIIIFHDANFGRLSPEPCQQFWGREDVNCNTNAETLATFRQHCGQTSSCKFFVSKDVFGNPCLTVTKYLDVKYSCRHKDCKEQTNSINTYSTSTSHNTYIGNVSSVTSEDQETTVPVETTPSTVSHQSNQQHSLLEDRRVLAITGIVLGVILAVIILVVICLVRRRTRLSKSRTMTYTESTEMNALDARRGYAYDYTEFNAHTNNTDHTAPGQQINGSSQSNPTSTATDDNSYDLSGHIAAGSESNLATWTHDNTYDLSGHVQNRKEPLNSVYGFSSTSDTYDDPSNKFRLPTETASTYDNFFGEQTEDQYDIASKTETGVAKRTDSVYS